MSRESTNPNKQVVEAYVEAFNRGDLEAVCRQFSPTARIHGVLGHGGLDVAIPIWRDLIECNAMHLRIESMIAEGDAVVVRYVESGTSVKPFRGNPATGKTYQVVAMEWFIVKDGLIQERYGARDFAAIRSQLGW